MRRTFLVQEVGKQLQAGVLLVVIELHELILAVHKFSNAVVGKQRVVIRIMVTFGRAEKSSEIDIIVSGVIKKYIRSDAKRNVGPGDFTRGQVGVRTFHCGKGV